MTRSSSAHVSAKLSYDDELSFGAVRAETVRFADENPSADRDQILAHLHDKGFGNSSYPVKKWIREAQDSTATVSLITLPVQDRHNVAAAFPEGKAAAKAAVPAPEKKAPKADPSWKTGSESDMAAHLLSHKTIPDRSWSHAVRLPKETRDAFIRRILLGEE